MKIAKKLKKNSVAVDVVSFGCEAENEEKVRALHHDPVLLRILTTAVQPTAYSWRHSMRR